MLGTKELHNNPLAIEKCPTGIQGLDEITDGGLPKGRAILIYGGAGCGKTNIGIESLARGAADYREPGVLITFNETEEELIANLNSIGINLSSLSYENRLLIDYIDTTTDILQTGAYNLGALFLRIESAIDAIGAKRVMLDGLEALYSNLSDTLLLRSEIRRLFQWAKNKGLTVLITGELGTGNGTRFGFEEYVSDCVIKLDHRIIGEVSTRRLIIQKYRGSSHETNEYPYLITKNGISILPITSLALDHKVSSERVSSGVAGIDSMLGGNGFYRGSTILVSGTPGSGKTSIAMQFVTDACRRDKKCLVISYEESPAQIIRNMLSIGLDLAPFVDKGLLFLHSLRPTLQGLEMHLLMMHRLFENFTPDIVVIDPASSLTKIYAEGEVGATLARMIDFMKGKGITALLTELMSSAGYAKNHHIGVSSLVDSWLMIREAEHGEERSRELYIIKSRGMGHSKRIGSLTVSENGIEVTERC
jgi:circadian clock protein KaiC